MSELTTDIRTFEITNTVTGFLEGTIKDWPAHIQDAIYAALERKAHEVELPLTIVHSRCDIDYGEAEDRSQDKYYIHVIASEIVAKDERFSSEETMKRAFMEHLANGTVSKRIQ
ncbi:hypothetical protein EKK58_09150 [Candidatus Dependentiae bacterium]|nr:MAG: hypothetical protein EKK58_09150 [Candidatus Dependentiae bacterium]